MRPQFAPVRFDQIAKLVWVEFLQISGGVNGCEHGYWIQFYLESPDFSAPFLGDFPSYFYVVMSD